jgi:polysaccharide export outer membrane protein
MHLSAVLKTGLFLTYLSFPSDVSPAQAVVTRDRGLQPGDHLRITVLSDDKNLSGEFEVSPDSTLKHPLYNQVKVAGVPLPMLKERIASFLRRFQREPQLEVEPLFKVTIGGEVKTPNIYLLAPETTVGDALALAGGVTDRGDLDKVTVLREGSKQFVSLTSTVANNAVLRIQSGDQITVPPRHNALTTVSSLTPILGIAASLLSITFVILARR